MIEQQETAQKKAVFEPGTLWSKIKERTQAALATGALQPIPTDCEYLEENGIRFLVRVASNLARKDALKKQQVKKNSQPYFNPFLPYEEELFVSDISDTHLSLLNKFNVVDYHLLIVTREFEEQDNWLNLQDFEAMLIALSEFDSLAFYNSGKIAGASQRHKHLQIVPLPLVSSGPAIPISPVIETACFNADAIGRIPAFEFCHALARTGFSEVASLQETAKNTLEIYHKLLAATDLLGSRAAYNLIATKDWMLLVPRSLEEFESISINSLGFAGTLFVRNQQQVNILKKCGPLQLLKNVSK